MNCKTTHHMCECMRKRMERLEEALKRIAAGTHEEHPTCCAIPKSNWAFHHIEFGPPATGGWEGWARDIDATHKMIAREALDAGEKSQ